MIEVIVRMPGEFSTHVEFPAVPLAGDIVRARNQPWDPVVDCVVEYVIWEPGQKPVVVVRRPRFGEEL
jgi:hypothetical protein